MTVLALPPLFLIQFLFFFFNLVLPCSFSSPLHCSQLALQTVHGFCLESLARRSLLSVYRSLTPQDLHSKAQYSCQRVCVKLQSAVTINQFAAEQAQFLIVTAMLIGCIIAWYCDPAGMLS